MLITIKTLSGRKVLHDFQPSQKIVDIKEILQEKEGTPKDQIRLIYAGKVINDEMTIEECNIQPGVSIMMALNMRG